MSTASLAEAAYLFFFTRWSIPPLAKRGRGPLAAQQTTLERSPETEISIQLRADRSATAVVDTDTYALEETRPGPRYESSSRSEGRGSPTDTPGCSQTTPVRCRSRDGDHRCRTSVRGVRPKRTADSRIHVDELRGRHRRARRRGRAGQGRRVPPLRAMFARNVWTDGWSEGSCSGTGKRVSETAFEPGYLSVVYTGTNRILERLRRPRCRSSAASVRPDRRGLRDGLHQF